MPMQEGDEFVSFKAFKAAMQDWAMAGAHKFNLRYKKSDSSRNVVVCAHDDCPFRISATFSSTRQCVVVVSIGEEHNCVGAGQISHGPSSQQTWLQRILPATLSINKSTTPRAIIDAVKLHHHVTITYDAAKKAKKLLLGDDLQEQAHQFELLPAYIDCKDVATILLWKTPPPVGGLGFTD